jgi:hypothetical protein
LRVELFSEVVALKQVIAQQREEIARLKGLKGPPDIKPSGWIGARNRPSRMGNEGGHDVARSAPASASRTEY